MVRRVLLALLCLPAPAFSALSVEPASLRTWGLSGASASALRSFLEAAPLQEQDLALSRLQELGIRRPDLHFEEVPAANLLYSAMGKDSFAEALASPGGVSALNEAASEVRRVAEEQGREALAAVRAGRLGAPGDLLRLLARYSAFLPQPEIEEWAQALSDGTEEHRRFLVLAARTPDFMSDVNPGSKEDAPLSLEKKWYADVVRFERVEPDPGAPRFEEILYPAALTDVNSLKLLVRHFPGSALAYNDALIPAEAVATQEFLRGNQDADISQLGQQIRMLRRLFLGKGVYAPRGVAHEVLDSARRALRLLLFFDPGQAPAPDRQIVRLRYLIGRMEELTERFPAVFVHYPGYAGRLASDPSFWKAAIALIAPGGSLLTTRMVFNQVNFREHPDDLRFREEFAANGKEREVARLLSGAFEPGTALHAVGTSEGKRARIPGSEVLVFKRRGG